MSVIDLKHKDEDSEAEAYLIQIEEISNGYIVTLEDSDGDEEKYAYDNAVDLIDFLKDILGAR